MDESATRTSTDRPRNRLLRALPAADFQRLMSDLKTIPVQRSHIFQKPGDRMEHVYFPNSGMVSVTAVLEDGMTVETATVGSEGMLGIEAFLGKDPVSPGESMMQVADPDTDVERLSVGAFQQELARQGALFDLMGKYAQAVIAQMMQSTACNARHQIHERCSRWLLMTHDRVGRDDFYLSHEFLATMLGVRRQSVSIAAAVLQSARLLTYQRGRVTILDRPGLESASCECYAIIRRRFDALQSA